MSKYIYNLVSMDVPGFDGSDHDVCVLVAFTKEEDAHEWRRDYVKLNYGTEFDMKAAGFYLWVESTIVEK